MGETTAQLTLDGYVDPTLGQLASQAYVQEQIALALGGAPYVQAQLPAGTQGQVFGPSGVAGVPALVNPSALSVIPTGSTTPEALADVAAQSSIALSYDIGAYIPGSYSSGQILFEVPMVRNVSYAPNFIPSEAVCASGLTAATTLAIDMGGTTIGNIAFSSGSSTGSISSVSTLGATATAGEIITIVAASIVEPSLQNVAINLAGKRF
jgi:hypothetical protein